MTIQEFIREFVPWLLGIAAIITSIAGARRGNVENVARNVETLQKMVDELVESRESLKKEKEEDKKRADKEKEEEKNKTDAKISELQDEIKLLKGLREADQKEIHDLHAMIGKNFVQEVIRIQAQALKEDK